MAKRLEKFCKGEERLVTDSRNNGLQRKGLKSKSESENFKRKKEQKELLEKGSVKKSESEQLRTSD